MALFKEFAERGKVPDRSVALFIKELFSQILDPTERTELNREAATLASLLHRTRDASTHTRDEPGVA